MSPVSNTPPANKTFPGSVKVSLFTLLGGAVLIAFSIVVGASLWGQYSLTNRIINKEIANSVGQNHALFQTVLNGQLKLINSQLLMLSQQEELTTLNENSRLPHIEAELKKLINHQNQANATDFIILGSIDEKECSNTHLLAVAKPIECRALVRQFDSNLYDWHLAKLDTDSLPTLISLTRVPIINHSGKVMAYLFGGITLTGNFTVINQAISSAAEQTLAVGIAYEDQLIASSAAPDSAEQQALTQAAQRPDRLIQALQNNTVAMSRHIELEQLRELDIRLVSVVRTDGQSRLQQGLIQQSSGMLVLAIILAIMIVLLTLRLSLTPLGRLRNLAARRHSNNLQPFNPGPVIEFQQLSHEVAQMLTDLRTTEQQLRHNSQLLERSHRDQEALINRNRKLLHQLLNLQEQERKHLARELHDELGQPLAVINTDAYLIKTASAADSKVHQYAESIQQNSNEMSDVVYRRIKSLRPMPLNDLGLVEAILHMPAIDNLRNHGISIDTTLPLDLPELSEQVEIHLFRIVQEGLTNILKHSQASKAWLRLQIDHGKPATGEPTLELEIADNGIGFNQADIDHQDAFGINGMFERVNSMNGCLTLEPHHDNGSRLRIRLMLTQQHRSNQEIDWQT